MQRCFENMSEIQSQRLTLIKYIYFFASMVYDENIEGGLTYLGDLITPDFSGTAPCTAKRSPGHQPTPTTPLTPTPLTQILNDDDAVRVCVKEQIRCYKRSTCHQWWHTTPFSCWPCPRWWSMIKLGKLKPCPLLIAFKHLAKTLDWTLFIS